MEISLGWNQIAEFWLKMQRATPPSLLLKGETIFWHANLNVLARKSCFFGTQICSWSFSGKSDHRVWLPSLLLKGEAIFLARKSVCEAAALRITQFRASATGRWRKLQCQQGQGFVGSQSKGWSWGSQMLVLGNSWYTWHTISHHHRTRVVTKTVHGNLSSFRQLRLSTVHTCTTICKLDNTVYFLSCCFSLTKCLQRDCLLATTSLQTLPKLLFLPSSFNF